MQLKSKSLWLIAGTLLAAGCASSDHSRMGPIRQGVNPKNDPAYMNAEDEKPPKILPDTHYAAGLLFEQQGLVDKAVLQYRKAVVVNHNFANAYHRLGITLSAVGKHDEAIDAFQRAVELRPGNAAVRNNLGFEYILTQRWDDAEQQLEQAIELQPDFARGHVNLGLVRARTGRFDQALSSFKRAMAEPDAFYNLGLTQRGQRRYDDAAESFRRVLELNPNFSAARVQLDQLADKITTAAPPIEEVVVEATTEETQEADPTVEAEIDVLAMLAELVEAPAQVEEQTRVEPQPSIEPAPTTVETEVVEAVPCAEEPTIVEEAIPEIETVEFADAAPNDVEFIEPVDDEPVVEVVVVENTPAITPVEIPVAATDIDLWNPLAEEQLRSIDDSQVNQSIDPTITVTASTWIPAEPLTEPTPLRDSWVLLNELETKVAMLQRELAEPSSLVLSERYDGEPIPAPESVEPAADEVATPSMFINPTDEPCNPIEETPTNEQPGDRRSDFSREFGELSTLLSMVINETRCWDAFDAELTALPETFDDEVDPFNPNEFAEEVLEPETDTDWEDSRLASPIP